MTKMKYLILLLFCICSNAVYSIPKSEIECMKNIYLKDKDGVERCAYHVIYHKASTTRKNHILELPTNALIEIMAIIGGPLGKVAKDSYYNEGHRYFLTLKPEGEYEGYLMCDHKWVVWSETGTKNWDNRNVITPVQGKYEWELNRKAFGARSWFKADYVWVSHHPDYTPDKSICEIIGATTMNELAKYRESIDTKDIQKDPLSVDDWKLRHPGSF